MKKISFVIPSYNSAWCLAHAIRSCQEQTYPNIEIVVVDDCSQDSTKELLAFLCEKDKRIKAWSNSVNMGRSESRNIGNRLATGEIILVLDCDDIAYPNRAALTAKKLEDADYVYGSADVIDALGTKLAHTQADVLNKENALKTMANRIVHSTVGIRRDIALKFPHLQGEAARLGVDDWSVQVQMMMADVRFDFIAPTIGAYRVLSSGVTATRKDSEVIAFKEKFLEQFKVAI